MVFLAIAVVMWILVRQEYVYHVTLEAGHRATAMIETRMQRTFEHKSFAKERGLPVVCSLTAQGAQKSDVKFRVVDTGHRLHWMWAKVHVEAAPEAEPGRHKWVADFTIDGESGWPQATLVVEVH